MADMMRWVQFNVHAAQSELADPLDALCTGIERTDSLASCFSGISADGIAKNIIHEVSEHMVGRSVNRPAYAYSIENDDQADLELGVLPHGPECRFHDILDFCGSKLRSRLSLECPPYDFSKLMAMASGSVNTFARCKAHN